MDPLGKLFGSPARLKLLRLFLFNREYGFTLSDAAFRAKVTKAAARKEIALLTAAGVVKRKGKNSKTSYQANAAFPHYEALHTFLRTTTSVKDADVINLFRKSGTPRAIILSGLFTGSIEPKVDILIVGDRMDDRALASAIRAIEADLGRELRYAAFSTIDFKYRAGVYDRLVRDVMDYPHRVIFDKLGL